MNFSIHTFELTDRFKYECEEKAKPKKTSLGKGVTLWQYDDGYNRTKKLVINPTNLMDGDDCLKLWKPTEKNIDKMLCKLKKYIADYADCTYTINDFELSRVDFTVNIDVKSQKAVVAYIKVLQNIGKITGFKPSFNDKDFSEYIHKERSFDLTHSDGIEFSAYNKWVQSHRNNAKNILRIEVRLKKRRAVRKYTKKNKTAEQIKDLAKRCEYIFMETFRKIISPGDYYTMSQAEKRVSDGVSHKQQKEKMLILLNLTKKDTLHSALNNLDYKNHGRLVEKFAKIDVSPITLRKDYGVKFLPSLYKLLK